MRRSILVILLNSSLCTTIAQSDHFFVTVSGGDLYKVNIQACSTTFIGATGFGFGDIAMTLSGELYGIVGGAIYRIDTTDASTTYIGQSTAPGVAMVALNNSTLLVEYAQDLYAISTIDATTTNIGAIGYGALGDLTWYWGSLYMSSGGQLIRIDSEDNYASILSVTPVGTFDPDMPICEGLATAMVMDFQSSIVGFSYPDLYCFSPVNGSYVVICQPALPGGVPGAASTPPAETPVVGCSSTSTGINPPRPAQGISIRPLNAGLEIIVADGLKAQEFRIRNSMGGIVTNSAVPTATGALVDLAGLSSGLYVVELVSGSRRFAERFIHSASR